MSLRLTPLERFRQLFSSLSRCAVIGMIHVKPLPGSPMSGLSVSSIVDHATEEALAYRRCGVDSVLVENMHDTPYTTKESPEVTACMVRVCQAVRDVVGPAMPCGVQILAAQNRAAVAVAAASDFNYVRAEGFVFSHIADEGLLNACAGDLLRYRASLRGFADKVAIFCDVKKKHSAHAITADVSIAETAQNADFFLADGLILTGKATGAEPDELEVREVASAVPHQPIILGSGITVNNFDRLAKLCHGVIVGSHFKKDEHWSGALDELKVQTFMEHVKNQA